MGTLWDIFHSNKKYCFFGTIFGTIFFVSGHFLPICVQKAYVFLPRERRFLVSILGVFYLPLHSTVILGTSTRDRSVNVVLAKFILRSSPFFGIFWKYFGIFEVFCMKVIRVLRSTAFSVFFARFIYRSRW